MQIYYEALKAAGVVRKARKQDKELDGYLSNKKVIVKVAVQGQPKLHEITFENQAQASKYIKTLKNEYPYFQLIK